MTNDDIRQSQVCMKGDTPNHTLCGSAVGEITEDRDEVNCTRCRALMADGH
jgi:hypothetical protein